MKATTIKTIYGGALRAVLVKEDNMIELNNDGTLLANISNESARKFACWILDVTLPEPLHLTEADHRAIVRKSKDRARARRA